MKPPRRDTFLPHVVYRAYDADGTLLYVGCTVDTTKRLRAHRRLSQWHALAVRFDYTEYSNYFQGRGAEAAAIRSESPVFNVQGRDVPPDDAFAAQAAYLATRTAGAA